MGLDSLMAKNLRAHLGLFEKTNLLIIGDVMLDCFIYGHASRISSEGPVPVLTATKKSFMLGGAGNAVSNLQGLGANISFIGIVGNDSQGETVKDLLGEAHLAYDGTLTLKDWRTTVKTRFLAQNQHLLKVDEENGRPIPDEAEAQMIKNIKEAIPAVQAVILSDYGQGAITEAIAQTAITLAKEKNIPVLVDPRGFDYSKYKGATLITPNRKELSEATQSLNLVSDDEIEKAAHRLIDTTALEAVVATRSQDGMSIIQRGKDTVHLKTHAIEVYDVSGAGDTVISVIATALATGASLIEAANLANLAGGIVVAKVGTAPIRREELFAALTASPSKTNQVLLSSEKKAMEEIARWRAQGKKIGFTNGCFDILHSGHVRYLNEAHTHCDRLIVALNHDQSVRLLKGPARPVHDERSRADVLGALGAVDMVVLFGATTAGEDNTPCALIEQLKPDIYFKGGDYAADELKEASIVRAYGGDVKILSLFEGHSTTNSIEKMVSKKAG